jgi:hypothetical protein
MVAIELGKTLTCNDLQVCFWDECVDPPVKRDPNDIMYSVGFYEGCTEKLYSESVNQDPIRSSVGCYWIPKLTNYDANLTPGKYFVKWMWKDGASDNWNACKQEFTIYQKGHCLPQIGTIKCAQC